MSTESTPKSCPKCGAAIAADAPQGLCPKCVLAEVATVSGPAPSRAGRGAAPSIEEVADQFPEFEIIELIGAGGMGAVYKARQPKLDRFVALKILSEELAEHPGFTERFNREGRALARLNHPHIVTVHDFGTRGPFAYLLMEFVDGVNLREAMRSGEFATNDCLSLVQDICAALKFAHEEGVLHRDIKPENVLLDSRGRVKIADFGLAKMVGSDEREEMTLTRQGIALGTPHYMAPEQVESPSDVDHRADIYSLGVVFYELLTGELPIGRFDPPSEKTPMDPRVDEVVMRALEKKREQRYQSVGEVETKVESISRSRVEPVSNAREPQASAAAATAPGLVTESARFALTSAVLTAVSLVLTGALILVMIAVNSSESSGLSSGLKETKVYVVGAVAFVVIGVPAFLGVLLGAKALGEIRESGCTKGGYGSAMFGTLTWPVLLIIALLVALLMFVLKGTETSIPWSVVFILVLILGITAPMLAVRFVGRWVGGATQEVPAQAEVRDEQEARFATASAILTGLSLLLAFASMILIGNADRDDRNTITALCVVVAGTPALLGLIFGAKALGEIRLSGGQKSGLEGALFGTMAWPSLLVVVASSFAAVMFQDSSGPVSPSDIVPSIAMLVGGGIVALLLVKAVRRKTLSLRGNGEVPRTSGMGSYAIALLVLAATAITASMFLPAGKGDSMEGSVSKPYPDYADRTSISSSNNSVHPANQPGHWEAHYPNDPPNLRLAITVPKGHAATIELVSKDLNGGERVIGQQWAAIASDSEPFEGSLAVGAPRGKEDEVWNLLSTFESLKGTLPTLSYTKSLQGNLGMSGLGRYEHLKLSNGESKDIEVAIYIPDTGEDTSAKTLSLRIKCEPRPLPKDLPSHVLTRELIGSGTPAELIEESLKKRDIIE